MKACPKCGGKMYLDRDSYGPYLMCRSCGYIKETTPAPVYANEKSISRSHGGKWGTRKGK